MPVVTALSEHPVAAEATAEVLGQVLDERDGSPDLAVVFVSAPHRDALGDIAATVRTVIEPGRLVGTTATGILGGAREVEDGPAVALWTATLGSVPDPVRLTAASTPAGTALQGLPHTPRPPAAPEEKQDEDEPHDPTGHTLLLLADPFSIPVPDILDVLAADDESWRVVGGLASAGMAPGANRLVLDDEVFSDGAVGVVLDERHGIHQIVVSQGCRPVGTPMIVTRSRGTDVVELAGQSALTRLEQVAAQAQPDEQALLAEGIHLGIVADEHRVDFGPGDFLVRNVVGADAADGTLSVGATVEVGTTVQFHVRDAATADEDLRALLAGHSAQGALVFTCNGRGRRLFGMPHHDAKLVADVTAGGAAGMFCAGEIGPIGERSFLHGFTACVLLVGH